MIFNGESNILSISRDMPLIICLACAFLGALAHATGMPKYCIDERSDTCGIISLLILNSVDIECLFLSR